MTGLLTRLSKPIATVLLILVFAFTDVPQRFASEAVNAYQQTTYEFNRAVLEFEWRIKRGVGF
jgi:hypothetical protein